jgi:hypothetical protein
MADFLSRLFGRKSATQETFTITDEIFLHTFSIAFPLQNDSWRIFRFSNKLASWIFSELRGEASTLGLSLGKEAFLEALESLHLPLRWSG